MKRKPDCPSFLCLHYSANLFFLLLVKGKIQFKRVYNVNIHFYYPKMRKNNFSSKTELASIYYCPVSMFN